MSGRVIFKTENGRSENGKLYKIDNADEAPANSQDKSNLVEVGENAPAGCEAEDEPKVGKNAAMRLLKMSLRLKRLKTSTKLEMVVSLTWRLLQVVVKF